MVRFVHAVTRIRSRNTGYTTSLRQFTAIMKTMSTIFAVDYFFIGVIGGFAISLAIIILTLWGYQTKIDAEKTSIYECGFTPFQSARNPLEIKFYLVSLLFIVFDVEILFLFPFAFANNLLSTTELSLLSLFIVFLFLGIGYEMRLNVLNPTNNE